MVIGLQTTQDLRQFARGDFAGSAGAGAVLGQAFGGIFAHGSQASGPRRRNRRPQAPTAGRRPQLPAADRNWVVT